MSPRWGSGYKSKWSRGVSFFSAKVVLRSELGNSCGVGRMRVWLAGRATHFWAAGRRPRLWPGAALGGGHPVLQK